MGVKVAIVGAGSMAREHARAFAAIPGVELAGIASRTRAKAEALAKELGIAEVYDSVDALRAGTKADVVVVTVFELAMKEVALACFQHPWTVLLEKPAGYDLAQAEAIHAAAKGQRVFVALNRRFLSSTRAALEDLAANPCTRMIHVHDQESLEQAVSIGHPPVVVQNWMYANSIHVVDYLRAFGRGKIGRVTPVHPWRGKDTRWMLATVEFDSGDVGIYEGIWKGPAPWAVTVNTELKRWEMRPLEEAKYQLAGTRKLEPVDVHPWDREFKPGFRRQAEEVAKAARGERSLAITIDESLESMRLVSALFAEPT